LPPISVVSRLGAFFFASLSVSIPLRSVSESGGTLKSRPTGRDVDLAIIDVALPGV